MTKGFFITSSGTDIGKTLITTSLCYQLSAGGREVHAIKPIISGFNIEENNDVFEILNSLNLGITEENINKVSRYRFLAAISPDMAAKRERQEINFKELREYCLSFSSSEYLLIEGVGGVMVPINSKFTTLD